MRWLHSGLRRDICVLLADGEQRGQQLRIALERHYEGRIDERQFYGALDALVESGHVERRADGIHDAFVLTPGGEKAMRAHYAWLTERLG